MGNFQRKGPCEKCGSRDNKAVYDDGTAYCFGCKWYYPDAEKEDGEQLTNEAQRLTRKSSRGLLTWSAQDIKKRALKEAICAKYGYGIGEFDGEPCHVACYRDVDGRVVAQKVRRSGKRFSIIGSGKSLRFFGQNLFNGGKSVVITEGEIDALSVATAFDGKWPVVSLPNGAQSAVKVCQQEYEWLDGFEKIVLCFDQDEPGREAAKEVAQVLPPGKAYIMALPRKDANEVLVNDGPGPITNAFWNASQWRPDGIRRLSDIREAAKAPIAFGLPWAFPTLTAGTFGRREGEVYTFGAGTGVGKTDIFTQQIEHDVSKLGEPVGVFFLEQQNVETVRRLAGKTMGKPFHVPQLDPSTALWSHEDYEAAVDLLADTDLVYLYNHFGQSNWDVIKSRIRFLRKNHGVRLIYLDNLTSLADPANERATIEQAMADISSMSQEMGLIFHLISHLSTPGHGKPHEAGGRVELMHFKGARAIGFWSHYAFGLERDKTHEDRELRNVTTIRCVKDRYTGQFDGETVHVKYDPKTTLLTETVVDFKDESGDDDIPF